MTSTGGLHTTEYGERGPWVVFCHGLFGQGKNWARFAKALAGDHRVRLIDMPNHGRSAWTDHLDYVDMADRVAAALPDEPVALVGHSMGGKAAMLLALRHAEKIARLCVVDVAPVAYDHGTELGGYIAAMRSLDLAGIRHRRDADQALAEAVPSPSVRGFLLQNLKRKGHQWQWRPNLALLGDELTVLTGWPADAVTGSYDGPVLWVGGDRSTYITDDDADEMSRLFPQVRRVTIKDAGHWVHSEQADVFWEVLRRFV